MLELMLEVISCLAVTQFVEVAVAVTVTTAVSVDTTVAVTLQLSTSRRSCVAFLQRG
jgi:hypothetical protein